MEINAYSKISFSSKKIPRYLYHLTDPMSAEKILKDGRILKSDFTLGFREKAVFLFDLKNFTKRWNRNKIWEGNDLAKDLLIHCSNDSLNLTLLRIPTDKLKKEDLRIRNLNHLFKLMKKTKHVKEGAPATESKRYKARKLAIEYLYPHEIDACNIDVLGTVEYFRNVYRKESLKGVFLKMFENQPEINCIKTLQNKR